MNKNEIILNSIIEECKIHEKRMDYASNAISKLFPLTGEKISALSDEQIALIDQMIYRFTKLQDAIGQKLFKVVLNYLDEDTANKSAIDIFNRLEQLEIVENYDLWKSLRDLRNEIAHDYGVDNNEYAEKLNLLFKRKNILKKYFNDILNWVDERRKSKL